MENTSGISRTRTTALTALAVQLQLRRTHLTNPVRSPQLPGRLGSIRGEGVPANGTGYSQDPSENDGDRGSSLLIQKPQLQVSRDFISVTQLEIYIEAYVCTVTNLYINDNMTNLYIVINLRL